MNSIPPVSGFRLSEADGYFSCEGVDLIAFEDIYPAGHQSGISLIMHGERLAANGDVRFEMTPGQWQPVPKQVRRSVDVQSQCIRTDLHFPDETGHLQGFNPMVYPDCTLDYSVHVHAEGGQLRVTVDVDGPIPPAWRDHLFFNLELFPGLLFGKSWIMDDAQGLFPCQPSGPILRRASVYDGGILPASGLRADYINRLMEKGSAYSPLRADEETGAPYAVGRVFTLAPEDPLLTLTVETLGAELRLMDGRVSHNNGWFVLTSPLTEGGAHAAEWILTPHVVQGWRSAPKIQISQVGYLPSQVKAAVVQLDRRDTQMREMTLWRLTRNGKESVLTLPCQDWGTFLRYRYLRFDFTSVTSPGLYVITCGEAVSSVFRIAPDVFDRGVWQPVLEYFLPVQMCHMRVSEQYRVWHGRCHMDDARMAPVRWNHFDGYIQGPDTLTRFRSGECVPGLTCGGWHDAGDFDLRVESQAGEAYLLTLPWEAFHVDLDATTIDQKTQTVEIHHPDGENDLLQQVEHGALTVLGAWRTLGRLYRGIIAPTLRQYVLLGDAVNMTDGVPGNEDDRWVFTEDNPARELTTAAHLAGICRALRDFRPALADEALDAARTLFAVTRVTEETAVRISRVHAAAELFLTTGDPVYADALLEEADLIFSLPERLGWIAARVVHALNRPDFMEKLRESLWAFKEKEDALAAQTPFGVPYKPHIWGAGWEIQRLGCDHYWLCKAFPDIFSPDFPCHALSFVLGCHPGESVSFASGIGAVSATTAYGFNRADASYIPGGVISGTALIRPDFPELKEWPYLWQQTEYVLGGGSSRFLFLVLAVRDLMTSGTHREEENHG